MLINSPENRLTIISYLEQVSEDDFINEFVVPYFSSNGYYHYRTNDHGPGEHGKDLVFYRSTPIFYDSEYVVVQAKAEKMTASNVAQFANQLNRAIDTKVTINSGGGTSRPNYGILVNARKHTNDADQEFYDLTHDNPNVKKLSQENVCDLIMRSGIFPARLKTHLMETQPSDATDADRIVFETLMSGDPGRIETLLERQLLLIKPDLSPRSKHMVIDYILNLWTEDASWDGTVKPMHWLNKHFDLIQDDQNTCLMRVLQELTSTTPSFAAQSDTYSVASKITPVMLASQWEDFLRFCAGLVVSGRTNYKSLPLNLLEKMAQNGLIPSDRKIDADAIIALSQAKLSPEHRDLYERVQSMAFPEIEDF